MRTVAHVSDLHFGRTDPQLVTRLTAKLNVLAPDLLVVSGDLTQRAKPEEFLEAREFLDSIRSPRLVIPGNHDIPLYNLYGRFVDPLSSFRRYISSDVEPVHADDELLVVSVNTARSIVFKGGRINAAQRQQFQQRLQAAPANAIKLLVSHHPIDLPGASKQALAGRARAALNALAGTGVDAILSGHLHVADASTSAEPHRIGGHNALIVQAGTAVSTRSRGEANSFNVIETEPDRITIRRLHWSLEHADFVTAKTELFVRTAEGWRRHTS